MHNLLESFRQERSCSESHAAACEMGQGADIGKARWGGSTIISYSHPLTHPIVAIQPLFRDFPWVEAE